MRRRRRDLRPTEAHVHWFAFPGVIADECADTVGKAAANWRLDARTARVDPPDGPLFGFDIERAHAGALIAYRRKVEHVVIDVAAYAHQRPVHARAGECFPLRAAGEPIFQTAMARRPAADQPFPIVGMRGELWIDGVGGLCR